MIYLLTGDTTMAQDAVSWATNFAISASELSGVASNNARWNGEQVMLVYDWCFNYMTPSQRQTIITRWNGYLGILMQKLWGGPSMPYNNYFWGYWRDEIEFGLETYYDSTANATIFLNDALVTRWQNSFLPWARSVAKIQSTNDGATPTANGGLGGVPPEGTEYGRDMFSYPVVPFESLKLMGRDLLTETDFFKGSLFYMIYTTTPIPTSQKGTSDLFGNRYYQVFPFGDDGTNNGYASAGFYYYGDAMTLYAEEWAALPLGHYARYWLDTVKPWVSPWVKATDSVGGCAIPPNGISLDYYAPGAGFVYARNGWLQPSTVVQYQLLWAATHGPFYPGTFQIWSNGVWLSKDSVGYGDAFAGVGGVGTVLTYDTPSGNSILLQGVGTAKAQWVGYPNVTRLETNPYYAYAVVDLTQFYQADQYHPWDTNPYAAHIERELLFIKPLQTLVVFDRVLSQTAAGVQAANVVKTFILHVPNQPTIMGSNDVIENNEGQTLHLTSVFPQNPSLGVVDESLFNGTSRNSPIYNYRIEEGTSGQAQSYFLNVLQARSSADADLNVSMVQDADSVTLTLRHPTLGNVVIQLMKGMTSTGGSFGFSQAALPTTLVPLNRGVELDPITDNGPAWPMSQVQSTTCASTTTATSTTQTSTTSSSTSTTTVFVTSTLTTSTSPPTTTTNTSSPTATSTTITSSASATITTSVVSTATTSPSSSSTTAVQTGLATSSTSSPVITPTQTQSTSTASVVTSSASASTGGVPEFSVQPFATTAFALLLVASYLVAIRRKRD
jgi:hypothetical protein